MGQCPNIENKQTKTDMSEDRRKKKKSQINETKTNQKAQPMQLYSYRKMYQPASFMHRIECTSILFFLILSLFSSVGYLQSTQFMFGVRGFCKINQVNFTVPAELLRSMIQEKNNNNNNNLEATPKNWQELWFLKASLCRKILTSMMRL